MRERCDAYAHAENTIEKSLPDVPPANVPRARSGRSAADGLCLLESCV
jgi:hypothetical protein